LLTETRNQLEEKRKCGLPLESAMSGHISNDENTKHQTTRCLNGWMDASVLNLRYFIGEDLSVVSFLLFYHS